MRPLNESQRVLRLAKGIHRHRMRVVIVENHQLVSVGQRLGISYSTVRTHLRSIGAKPGARSMLNAVVTPRELELVT